jgi:hypothetical protein
MGKPWLSKMNLIVNGSWQKIFSVRVDDLICHPGGEVRPYGFNELSLHQNISLKDLPFIDYICINNQRYHFRKNKT